jgi:hypothetical protein
MKRVERIPDVSASDRLRRPRIREQLRKVTQKGQ